MARRRFSRRRYNRRRANSQHLWHQATFCIVNTTGDYHISASQMGIVIDRICKIKKTVISFNAEKNVGQVFTFTVGPPDVPGDAPCRSSPRLITKVQQTVSLLTPISSDFGYYSADEMVINLSLITGWKSAPASIASFYNVRMLVEYRWQKEHRVEQLDALPSSFSRLSLDSISQ